MLRGVLFSGFLFLLWAAQQKDPQGLASPKVSEREPIELCYLANEGFLIRSNDAAVVIDAFVSHPYSAYAGLSRKAANALEKAKPPFDKLDLALVTHVHGDHFQEPFACRALAQSKALLATTPQVLESLHKYCQPKREQEIDPALGTIVELEHEKIRVEMFRLSHGPGRFASIQNLGHVIHVGGWKLLHLGDATLSEAEFAPFDLASKEIDIAFIPYWYFTNKIGRKLINERIRARHLIAVHVPPTEVEALKERLEGQAFVFEKSLDRKQYE